MKKSGSLIKRLVGFDLPFHGIAGAIGRMALGMGIARGIKGYAGDIAKAGRGLHYRMGGAPHRAAAKGLGLFEGLSKGAERARIRRGRGVEEADTTRRRPDGRTVAEIERGKYASRLARLDFRQIEAKMRWLRRQIDYNRNVFSIVNERTKRIMLIDIMKATEFYGKRGEHREFSEKHGHTFNKLAEQLEAQLKTETDPETREEILLILEKMIGKGIKRAELAMLNIRDHLKSQESYVNLKEWGMVQRIVTQMQQAQQEVA